MNQNNRRNFIKNAAVLGMGVPAAIGTVSAAFASDANTEHANTNAGTSKQAPNQFSIFITTDLHAQLHTSKPLPTVRDPP